MSKDAQWKREFKAVYESVREKLFRSGTADKRGQKTYSTEDGFVIPNSTDYHLFLEKSDELHKDGFFICLRDSDGEQVSPKIVLVNKPDAVSYVATAAVHQAIYGVPLAIDGGDDMFDPPHGWKQEEK